MSAQPSQMVVGNMVRRVLKVIRDEEERNDIRDIQEIRLNIIKQTLNLQDVSGRGRHDFEAEAPVDAVGQRLRRAKAQIRLHHGEVG